MFVCVNVWMHVNVCVNVCTCVNVWVNVCVFRQQALFHVLTAYSIYNTVSHELAPCLPFLNNPDSFISALF